jgi:hypothetical protein
MWGKFPTRLESGKAVPSLEYDHISFWQCNYTWFEETAEVKLHWADQDLRIDHAQPPVLNDSTKTPWDPPFSIPHFGLDDGVEWNIFSGVFPEVARLNRISGTGAISNVFYPILEPYGSIRLQDFGQPNKDNDILREFNSMFSFICTQLANLEHRLKLDTLSAAPPFRYKELPPLSVIITDNKRRRIIQNPIATYSIISILTVVILINIWALLSGELRHRFGIRSGWLIDMELRDLAPYRYDSISAIYSLLCDSNINGIISRFFTMNLSEELRQYLSETRFRLGLFRDSTNDKRVFTVGTLDDDAFKFEGDEA